MFTPHPRTAGLLMALILALTSLSLAAPVAAADSPEGAVNELIDMAASGDLSSIDQVVCEEQRDAALQQFDPGTALGLSLEDQALLDAFTFRVEERTTEVLSQDESSATVRLTATLNISIDESQARDMVRALLEAEGSEVDEEDIDLMLPFMLGAFGEGQEIDDELILIVENGQWLVCGGLGSEQLEPVGPAPSVSFEGVCGLTSIAQLNAITPDELQYDSSFGSADFCSYSVSSVDNYRSLTLSMSNGDDLENYRAIFPDGTDLTIAGSPAFALVDQVYVGLDEGVFHAIVFAGDVPPADFDPLAYLSQVAELYIPLVPELEVDVGVAPIEPTPAEIDVTSLCETVSLDEINGLSAVSFDDVSGAGDYCTYSTLDADSGFSVVSTSINFLGLDDMREFFPDGEDLVVAGQPAYRAAEQLWVGLDDGERTLAVGAYLDASQVPEGFDTNDFAAGLAELALADLVEADDDAE